MFDLYNLIKPPCLHQRGPLDVCSFFNVLAVMQTWKFFCMFVVFLRLLQDALKALITLSQILHADVRCLNGQDILK